MKKKSDPEPLQNGTAVADVESLGEQLADVFARKYLAVGGKSGIVASESVRALGWRLEGVRT